jgi:hypothetical protein
MIEVAFALISGFPLIGWQEIQELGIIRNPTVLYGVQVGF